jgi:AraC-like DNA-binding protein
MRRFRSAGMESSGSMYREYPAPAPLASVVECLWRRALSDEDRAVVLPDGRVDLVWMAGGEPLVAGPQTRFVPRPPAAAGVAIGVRFHPSVGPPLLGLPAHELVDLHVPLAAVDTVPAAALRRRLPVLAEPDEVGSHIQSALTAWLSGAGAPDNVLRAAIRLLDAPGASVAAIGRVVGYSERELRRRFRESVGYGPKTLQRVLRFQRVLAALEPRGEPAGSLARLAVSAGYSDQAHMTRETRELSGLTPLELAHSR